MWLLAQASGEQWWEAVPAQIVLWGTALLIVITILKRMFGGAEFTRRLLLAFIDLGETDEWPNGSTSLPSSLTAIYGEVKALREDFDDHIREFEEHARKPPEQAIARRGAFLRVVFGRGELKPGGDMAHVETGRRWKPDRKIGHAVAVGTPAGTIIAWAVESGIGWDVPAMVATAFGGLVTGLWAYFTRDRK